MQRSEPGSHPQGVLEFAEKVEYKGWVFPLDSAERLRGQENIPQEIGFSGADHPVGWHSRKSRWNANQPNLHTCRSDFLSCEALACNLWKRWRSFSCTSHKKSIWGASCHTFSSSFCTFRKRSTHNCALSETWSIPFCFAFNRNPCYVIPAIELSSKVKNEVL